MKQYEITLEFDAYFMYEPSDCPDYWRGSGVYDEEVHYKGSADLDIYAETEERARELAEDFPLESKMNGQLGDGPWITEVKLIDDDVDEEVEEVWNYYIDESDPDEYDD